MAELSLRGPTSLMWCQSQSLAPLRRPGALLTCLAHSSGISAHASHQQPHASLQLTLCFMIQCVFRALVSSFAREGSYLDRRRFPDTLAPLKRGPLLVGCGILHSNRWDRNWNWTAGHSSEAQAFPVIDFLFTLQHSSCRGQLTSMETLVFTSASNSPHYFMKYCFDP